MRKFFALCTLLLLPLLLLPAMSQTTDLAFSDMTPRKSKMPYKHILAIGVNRPISEGKNEISPLFTYYWFGENFANPDLYMQFYLSTTRISFITAYKTDRIYAGIRPLVQHSTFSAWRYYNRGYGDERRAVRGSNVGAVAFFQYNFVRIFSAKLNFHPSYHIYRMPVLAKNENKYVNMPNRHWQMMPSIELQLSDVRTSETNRVKHGYLLKGTYQYARRIGYGTWYDYDRVFTRERYDGMWLPVTWFPPSLGANMFEGVWYKSNIKDTHRIYFNVGAYYNFKGNYNIQLDCYGGYMYGVDRNNAEQIGYIQADNAAMPGYFNTEFYHNMYVISRVQVGVPIPFWSARIQPGFNMLYMPKGNDVVGLGGKNRVWFNPSNPYAHMALRNFPRTLYMSASCGFSLLLGNMLPLFIDYAYGFNATRAKSANAVLKQQSGLSKAAYGNHEVQVLVVMAFGKNE